jgi:hypothetical protein
LLVQVVAQAEIEPAPTWTADSGFPIDREPNFTRRGLHFSGSRVCLKRSLESQYAKVRTKPDRKWMPVSRMILQMLGAFAELERSVIQIQDPVLLVELQHRQRNRQIKAGSLLPYRGWSDVGGGSPWGRHSALSLSALRNPVPAATGFVVSQSLQWPSIQNQPWRP